MRSAVIMCLAAGLLASWCIAPAATAAPALTATPPAAPVPTPAQVGDAALASWRAAEPAWQEDFSAQAKLWPAGAEDGGSRYVAQSAYHIEVPARRTLSLAVTPRRAGAFLFEATVTQTAGPLDSEYGLLFGCRQGQDCYFFAASSDGYFLLDVWQAGKRTSLIEPALAPPAALHTGLGAANRLGVAVQDAVITLYANDVALGSRYAAQWQPGCLGAGVATNRQGGAEVLFDDFKLWLAPGQPEEAGPGGISGLLANLPALPTPAPPETPAPSKTLAPAGSLAESIAALRSTPPTWQETFDVGNGRWFTGVPENGSCDCQDGGLALALDGADYNWCGHFEQGFELPTSYLLEVTATELTQSAQPPLVCLWFSRHGQDAHEFCLGAASYSLSHGSVDSADVKPLIEPVLSPAVQFGQGAKNRFGVLVEDTAVTLLINDRIVQRYEDEDATWGGGEVGLLAATDDPDGATVLFDDLRLWAVTSPLPKDGAGAAAPTPAPVVAPALADLPIAWDELLERFAISNQHVEEVLEPGHKIPNYFVAFDFEVIAATAPRYYVEFLNLQEEVKTISTVEFVMDGDTPPSLLTYTGGWLAGVKGTATFALPRDFAKYPAIVIAQSAY